MMDALLPSRSVFFGRGEQASSPPVEDQPLPSSEGAGLILPDVGSDDQGEDDDEVATSEAKEPTVVRLDEEEQGPVAPVAPMELDASAAVPKKRGRPSLSASASRNGTPARSAATSAKTPSAASKARTPRYVAKAKQAEDTPAASSSRKRKAADKDDEKPATAAPAAKRASRGRPPASRPVSARKAAADAKKNLGPTKQKAAKAQPATKGQRGRPRKEQEEDGDAWEVDSIVDSGIDADSSEHMYLVKWKGYSDKDNTWEPKRNLAGCADLLRKFEASNKKTRAPRQKKTK